MSQQGQERVPRGGAIKLSRNARKFYADRGIVFSEGYIPLDIYFELIRGESPTCKSE